METYKTTIEFLHEHIWLHISRESNISNHFYGAIAYFSDASMLTLRHGDLLVVNASDNALHQGSTDPRILKKYLDSGVNIFSNSHLHSKVYVFDNCTIVGSMNASAHSRTTLLETAILSRDKFIINEAYKFVQSTAKENSSLRVDDEFLAHAIDLYKPLNKQERSQPLNTEQRKIWLLVDTPHGANLRAYFISLIVVQIHCFLPNKEFALWPDANVSGHIKNNRLEKKGTRYILKEDGIKYFSSDEQWPEPSRLSCFIRAITTGKIDELPDDLPNKMLKAFFV